MTLRQTKQRELFAAEENALPSGFVYCDDAISKKNESDLISQIEGLPFKPFEFHGYLGNRRIVSFGWRYDYAARTLRESAPLPTFLMSLRNRLADIGGLDSARFQQALVTEYAPGAGIGWHRDKPEFEDVMAVSLLSPCRLRFRRKRNDKWERAAAIVAPRSWYLLRGAARHEWYHSIPAVSHLRYSITFRNFRS